MKYLIVPCLEVTAGSLHYIVFLAPIAEFLHLIEVSKIVLCSSWESEAKASS